MIKINKKHILILTLLATNLFKTSDSDSDSPHPRRREELGPNHVVYTDSEASNSSPKYNKDNNNNDPFYPPRSNEPVPNTISQIPFAICYPVSYLSETSRIFPFAVLTSDPDLNKKIINTNSALTKIIFGIPTLVLIFNELKFISDSISKSYYCFNHDKYDELCQKFYDKKNEFEKHIEFIWRECIKRENKDLFNLFFKYDSRHRIIIVLVKNDE